MKIGVITESPSVPRTVRVTEVHDTLNAALEAIVESGDEVSRRPYAIAITTPEGGSVILIDTDAYQKNTGTRFEDADWRSMAVDETDAGDRMLIARPARVTTNTIRSGMAAKIPVIITFNAYTDLEEELGDADAVHRFLIDLATEHQKPIGINMPSPGGSQTMLIGPRDWTQDRLQGWAGRMGPMMEAQFGKVATIRGPGGPNRHQRRKNRRK